MVEASLHVLLAFGATLVVALLLGEVAQRFGEPALLGEILAGVLLGPHLLGLLDPEGVLGLFAVLGGVLLLFDAGYEELDLESLRRSGRSALLIALSGMALPLAAGFGLAWLFGYGAVASSFLGLALAATSIAVSARVLMELGRLGKPYGVRIVGAAVVDDVVTLLLFAVLLAFARTGAFDALGTATTVGGFVLFFAGAWLFRRFLMPHAARFMVHTAERGGAFLAMLGLVFLFAWPAGRAGLDPIIGAFVGGLVLGGEERLKRLEIRQGVVGVAYGLFIPLFFAAVGARLDPSVLVRADLFLALVVAVGILAKFAGGFLGSLLARGDRATGIVSASAWSPAPAWSWPSSAPPSPPVSWTSASSARCWRWWWCRCW